MAWTLLPVSTLTAPSRPGTATEGVAAPTGTVTRYALSVPNNTTVSMYLSLNPSYQNHYFYLTNAAVGINTDTGAPSSSILTYTADPNSTYPLTWTNSTGSTVTTYLYIRDAVQTQALAQSVLSYSFAVYTPPAGTWSVGNSYTLDMSTITASNALSGVAVSCAAGKVAKVLLTLPAYAKATIYSTTTSNVDVYGYLAAGSVDVNASTGAPTANIITYDDNSQGSGQYRMTYTAGAISVGVYIYHRCVSASATCSSTIHVLIELPALASGFSYWNGGSTYYPNYLIGKGTAKNTTIDPATITRIEFSPTSTAPSSYSASWDCSENVDGRVTAYANGTTIYVRGYGASQIAVGNQGALSICNNMANCTTIVGCNYLNTSNVTNFSDAFTGSGITGVPTGVNDWVVTQGTNFQGVFWNCQSITTISLTWSTPNGTNFQGFVGYCTALKNLYINSLNTTAATNMSLFFDHCYALKEIHIGANFKQKGASGTLTGAEFPDQSDDTVSTVPRFSDSIIDGRWRRKGYTTYYARDAIPQAQAWYSCYLPDGRTTLATHEDADTYIGYNYKVNGTTYTAPYWLYAAYQRGYVSLANMNTIHQNVEIIKTQDSYTEDGTHTYKWDASQYQDRKVWAYYFESTKTILIAGNGAGYIDLGHYATNTFYHMPALREVLVPDLKNSSQRTQHIDYWFRYSPNVEKIDISGLIFGNFVNSYYMHTYLADRTYENNVQTVTPLAKLSWLKVGTGYWRTHAGPLPTPTSGVTVVPTGGTFDGSWHDETGTAYTTGSYNSDNTITAPSIPSSVAHIYTAYIQPVPTEWTLKLPEYTLGTLSSTSTRTASVSCMPGEVARIRVQIPAYSTGTFTVSTTGNIDVYGYIATNQLDITPATGAPTAIYQQNDNGGTNGQWILTYATNSYSQTIYLYHRCVALADSCASVITGTCTTLTWSLGNTYVMPSFSNYNTSTCSVDVTCDPMKTARIEATIPPNSTVVFSSTSTIDTYGYLNTSAVGITATTGAPTAYVSYNDDTNGNQWQLTYTTGANPETIYIYHRSFNGRLANTATITGVCTAPEGQEPSSSGGVWKLYNGTEWVTVYPSVYNGTAWVSAIGTLYDGSEWK